MKEKVLGILKDESVKINFCGLKKKLGITRKHLDDELRSVLEKLELDGLVYSCDDFYQKFPSNFFIATVQVSKKGNRFILYNDMAKSCKEQNLEGVLNYDTVVFKKVLKNVVAVKVLARKMPNVICDVKLNEDGIKYLSVFNSKNNIPLVIDHNSMKKLVEGERIIVNLSTEKIDNKYMATFVERIGNKNDLDSELMAIAYNNGFVTKYPNEALKELDLIPDEVSSDEIKGRLDKRSDNVFTIDGKGAKDLDDAISIKVLPNKNFQLTVSIANVSHYIKYGTALWKFAEENTTSVYLINSVMSMFHAKISNGICSLNPLVDRLARSFVMEIDNQGNVVDYKMINSVINSKKKMNYDDVNSILENDVIPSGYEAFVDDLRLMEELSHILTVKRENEGSIEFDSSELNFKTDTNNKVIETEVTKQRTGENMIENFMVITNEVVAMHFFFLACPFIYRNHEVPMSSKISETIHLFKQIGYKMETLKDNVNPGVIQKMIKSICTKEEFPVLSVLILKSMQRAYFGIDNQGHFGLALKYYSQSTAPIRRFLDLVIHTLIDYYETMYEKVEQIEGLEDYLTKICENASIKERCADKAEYEANQIYMAKYMESRIGEEFYGFVADINPYEVLIKTTDLIEGYATHEEISNSNFKYDPEFKMLLDKKSKERITIGSKVLLKLKGVSLENRTINFEILEYNLDTVLERTLKK